MIVVNVESPETPEFVTNTTREALTSLPADWTWTTLGEIAVDLIAGAR